MKYLFGLEETVSGSFSRLSTNKSKVHTCEHILDLLENFHIPTKPRINTIQRF